ncbi:glycosyltransferase family 9 protein [Chitinophaga japonensis]|uniref:ADP-heptose:LPS heptosyltransferase n=1 Tax=Chitinophaga japonensis TaxID=104662 RepID=A0A562SP63_CHIJA|nr:glycosyltransferase family 9 protein [Chitinophaga japonensis]TWI82674.1 ADP-heptose:LPS heptosyltransferase [Chitinophaga japonensis]
MNRILCIRLDNMGDLIMSSPAIRALKNTFQCHITVLTSSMGAAVTSSIPDIDETLVFDAPWVQNNAAPAALDAFNEVVERLRRGAYDAAVIFTVYSQNPQPSIMLAYMAGIPLRLAYCRENPYHLLTHWVPEKEPYDFIRHQVRRDLDLVAQLGATAASDKLVLEVREELWPVVQNKLAECHLAPDRPWIILHTGVSDARRQYPMQQWIDVAKALLQKTDMQLLLTGTAAERAQALRIRHGIGRNSGVCVGAGLFSLPEFITLVRHSALVISVNTGTVHIAAATGTPVLVLYALTNPQHTPWKVPGKVLYFDVAPQLRSKNEVIRYVYNQYRNEELPPARPEYIVQEAIALLQSMTPGHRYSTR